MEPIEPYCTLESNENHELKQLFSEGIQIWSTSQEVLEKQALKELEILVEETQENKTETNATKTNLLSEPNSTKQDESLNIENYIRQQEGLRKCKRSSPKKVQKKNWVSLVENEPDIVSNSEENNRLDNEQETNYHNKHKSTFGEDNDSGSEYVPSTEELSEDDHQTYVCRKNKLVKKVAPIKLATRLAANLLNVKDDALLHNYKARLNEYYKRLEAEHQLNCNRDKTDIHFEDKQLKGGLKIPIQLWNKLYVYQQDGIKWLWELHQKSTGGLLGDEMGLGKTVQIIAFLHSLQYSRILSQHCRFVGVGPTIIVCPATVIHQWVKHFHEWSPEFRVAILHQSGSHQGNKAKLIDEINRYKGIIITTYVGILKFKGNLCEYNWQYLILDEGHKIRNPTAKISVAVKHLRTPHRIMLTGCPMQNNLTELWSLFDFTNPGMLGNLATFTEHFANPILQGGFTNSSPMQEATALSVAKTLKTVISPYLLRRMKNEVQDDICLPQKSEQVLFCSLTQEQHDIYKDYLMSEKVNNILGRGIKSWKSDKFVRANMLVAITDLRKICNHPDIFLFDEEPPTDDIGLEEKYGYYKRSGKMIVVSALLKIWKKQGHRVLLFSQGRAMIAIFENFLKQQGYNYLKMDGSTNIASRHGIINKFNQDSSYDVFLLTTRVGGLGVNLTGANRVIIYDPDWNPATDAQARERAWRIGQEKSVTVYRLVSAGTVEEKMYQRQIWKQLLSNKVLIDPSTNKFFKSSDLFDLFSLPESTEANPETTNIFRDSRVKIQERYEERKKHKKKKSKICLDQNSAEIVEFSDDKIQAMKNLAQQIAKSLTNGNDKKEAKPEPKKTLYQKELEEQRQLKLKSKEALKKLTPQQLFEYNRLKPLKGNDDTNNKIDDRDTNVSFDKALEHSSKTANLYYKIQTGKIKESELVLNPSPSTSSEINNFEDKCEDSNSKKNRSNKRKHKGSSIDMSGKIDGEEVEGLVKCETKRNSRKKSKVSTESQDNYILEHLFSKKGVSGALEHDSIINGGKKQQSLKVRTHADEKALKSLEVLKKSRLNNWKW